MYGARDVLAYTANSVIATDWWGFEVVLPPPSIVYLSVRPVPARLCFKILMGGPQ